jgi:YD repeat-containing protein
LRNRAAVDLCTAVLAQQSPGIQYVYDDLGRLSKVIDPAGNVAEYVYDAVGNILEIKRSTITGLALLNFTPSRGPVGTLVTIQGRGFSAIPAENQVVFHDALAPVLAATDTQLVVNVRPGATTGPITVAVGGNTATSPRNFTVPPSITTINPTLALAGSTIADLQVQGNNLTGTTFTFLPASGPPLVTVTSAVIASTGMSATLQATVPASAAGNFVLVATNAEGRSRTVPSAANTLRILAGNADMASGPPVSMLNSTDPGAIPPRQVSGPVVSMLNPSDPATEPARTAAGLPVSILNRADPSGPGIETAMGGVVSVENLAQE